MQRIKYLDISWPITNDMTTYKNKQDVERDDIATFEVDGFRQSYLALGTHTGTHIDAPAHFLEDGITVEHIALDTLLGPCEVIDLSFVDDKITQHSLRNISITKDARILCKTKNSKLSATAPFDPHFIVFDASAAEYLVACGIKTIGLDYLGIERGDPSHQVHKIFMENDITIIEGLRLDAVTPGTYNLICLPLLIPGQEAAPARALLELPTTQ